MKGVIFINSSNKKGSTKMKRELLNYKKELRKVIEICLKAYDYVKQDVLSNIFMFI